MNQQQLDRQRAVAKKMKEMVDDFEYDYGYWSGPIGHVVVQDYNFDVRNILWELKNFEPTGGTLTAEGETNKCEDYDNVDYLHLYHLLHRLLEKALEFEWWTIWETYGIVHDEWMTLEELVAWRNANWVAETVE